MCPPGQQFATGSKYPYVPCDPTSHQSCIGAYACRKMCSDTKITECAAKNMICDPYWGDLGDCIDKPQRSMYHCATNPTHNRQECLQVNMPKAWCTPSEEQVPNGQKTYCQNAYPDTDSKCQYSINFNITPPCGPKAHGYCSGAPEGDMGSAYSNHGFPGDNRVYIGDATCEQHCPQSGQYNIGIGIL